MAYINGKQIMNVEVHIINPEIKFTIDGNEYTATDGMTWGGWCYSTYNTIGAVVDENGEIYANGCNILLYGNNEVVTPFETVINGGEYVTA